MTGNEYQELAMRTNDHKATDRLLGNMLTCDMKYLLQENLIAEDERHLDIGGIFTCQERSRRYLLVPSNAL